MLAFVQNATTNEVLNSGTKFDAITTADRNISVKQLKIYPTIAQHQIFISMRNEKSAAYEIFNIQGQSVHKGILPRMNQPNLQIGSLSQGVYWLKLNDGADTYLAKFVKG